MERSIASIEADDEIDLNHFDVEESETNFSDRLTKNDSVNLIRGDVSRRIFHFTKTAGLFTLP